MARLRSLIKEVLSQPKKKDCNCGCNTCGNKSPVLTEGKTKINISEGLTYHMDKKIPLHESVYRIGSNKHFDLINEARTLWVRGLIDVSKDDQAILETHLGNFGMYEGEKVPLDMPMVNEGYLERAIEDEKDPKKLAILKAKKEFFDNTPKEKRRGMSDDEIRNQIKKLVKEDEAAFEYNKARAGRIIKDLFGPDFEFDYTYKLEGDRIIIHPEGYNDDGTLFDMKDVHKEKIIRTFQDKMPKAQAQPNMGGGITVNLKESLNEGFYSSPLDMDETGLNVRPKDQIHANMLKDALENSGLYAEWNAREGYFFFPEEQDLYDQLEMEIQDLMDENNIQGYIEGVFEESLNEDIYDKFLDDPQNPKGRAKAIISKFIKQYGEDASGMAVDRFAKQNNLKPEEKYILQYITKNDISISSKPGGPDFSALNEVTRYSGFNRNPEDPDSEKFEPTGALSQFQEDLRALFGKFKGDLKNPEFIKGVAEIMVSWKSLLRSQLNEERTFTTNPNIKELKKGMTVRVINSKKHVSGPGTFSSGSVKKIGKIVSIGKNKVTINVPDREKPIIATTVGSVGYMGEDFEIVDDILNEAKKKKKKEKKDPPLGKPKRGGSKAYYVYVRDPKTKKIKKVSFGSGGLRAKIKNKKARNAFASRHNCDKKKDRTTAGYWSCNLPRYADQLGLGSKMNTFW